jgi:hypothetical protein
MKKENKLLIVGKKSIILIFSVQVEKLQNEAIKVAVQTREGEVCEFNKN